MANLSLTSGCNRNCSFCFANDAARTQGQRQMAPDTFSASLDLLERSGIGTVRILGGEPTLHPRFAQYLGEALTRGFNLLVFTGGMMPETALQALAATPLERVQVLLNVAWPERASEKELRAQKRLMELAGGRILPGVTIDHPRPELGFLLRLIETFQLRREVRLGLAHPSLSGDNRSLPVSAYRSVGTAIARFRTEAGAAGVSLGFDCGFVPCMFPPEFLQALGEPLGQRCNPIVDILPGGNAISCFPLADLHSEDPGVHDTDASLRAAFEARRQPHRAHGIFPECESCNFRKRGECGGGCLSASIRRTNGGSGLTQIAPSTKGVPGSAGNDAPAKSAMAIPYIDQPLEFWYQLAERFGGHIAEVYFPLPVDVIASGRPVLPSRHTNEFLRFAPVAKAALLNPVSLPGPVEAVAPGVLDHLARIAEQFGIGSVTVSHLGLAMEVRKRFPKFQITASVLMDIAKPNQAMLLDGVCDVLVPATRVMRNLRALRRLRNAFRGKIRLLVNEACLQECPYRVQHFQEMAYGAGEPRSMCDEVLQQQPWMRLTGAWVLPQHLHLLDGVFDELKLAGRVTLSDPDKYMRVLDAYVHRKRLLPHEIGGGPASVLGPVEIEEEFYRKTLVCDLDCDRCNVCRDYHAGSLFPILSEPSKVHCQGCGHAS